MLASLVVSEAAPGEGWVEVAYIAAALLFIFGLKRLSRVRTARQGNGWAALGMLLAIVATALLVWRGMNLAVVLAGVLVGSVAGVLLAKRVPMTAMPELVALFNGLGGGGSMLVAWAEVARFTKAMGAIEGTRASLADGVVSGVERLGGVDYTVAAMLSVLIGAVTLSGSLIAYGKLSGKVKGARFGPLGLRPLNALILVAALGLMAAAGFAASGAFTIHLGVAAVAVASLVLGVGLVVPIGGADMPVVISLLNSYSGIAASMTGFVIHNNVLIIAGALVGSSGIILSQIMCKAMNRSLANVLFGAFGGDAAGGGKSAEGLTVRQVTVEDAAVQLGYAQFVIVVPGYGLAVAQAQHTVRELADLIERRGGEVKYAIHPVAGRMPGHMNVLLAEANVPYEKLCEMDQINDDFQRADVALVIGANDVVNPAARSDAASPIYGMPILNADQAKSIIVMKRGMSAGFAGIENELFYNPKTAMLFGDAKKSLTSLVAEIKAM